MTQKTYRDLIVWQQAKKLTVEIYEAMNGVNDFGFKDQIQRAAVSVMNNIAEGYARKSDKAFKNFLSIARGSIVETESMVILGYELGYIPKLSAQKLSEQTVSLTKQLTVFINKL